MHIRFRRIVHKRRALINNKFDRMILHCAILLCFVGFTLGLVPKPFQHEVRLQLYDLSDQLIINHNNSRCFILQEAIKRFMERFRDQQPPLQITQRQTVSGTITTMEIEIAENCDELSEKLWPEHEMNERYSVYVKPKTVVIRAETVWGALHGLETTSQLFYRTKQNLRVIQAQELHDNARFGHRGFLIDTSRHFLPVETIFQFLDAMAMVKMNVLHWHIVDTQSFPYQSYTYPKLSDMGAYDSIAYVYTKIAVERILEYARLRGIRVMPEFDTPGHAASWGLGYPKLLTECYKDGKPTGVYGPINPVRTYTYEFLIRLFEEVTKVFPDKLIHLGGDEVVFDCWQSNPEVLQFMDQMGMGRNFTLLQSYYTEQLIKLVRRLPTNGRNMIPVVWQEVFENGFRSDKDTIIHVWKGDWPPMMKNITKAGFHVLFSSCWYLDLISYGVDWPAYYNCDPTSFGGTPEEIARVIGGEAALWGEHVDHTNLFSRAWPRGVAVAERLWSSGNFSSTEFAPRLDEVRCRMIRRGWEAEPGNGPGYCPP
ncbi:Beta-hexosaminidase subunit alpha [Paragonimus heterotremus]|uniref:Beta-hexosaminidase n=1 Tax=Paragonimus heterotremus TaxID=100268 RepID=A0A8J4T808_9TREM|nr:Beta-hexosaminidase subunit alpha [Paragonimus heterotremus]